MIDLYALPFLHKPKVDMCIWQSKFACIWHSRKYHRMILCEDAAWSICWYYVKLLIIPTVSWRPIWTCVRYITRRTTGLMPTSFSACFHTGSSTPSATSSSKPERHAFGRRLYGGCPRRRLSPRKPRTPLERRSTWGFAASRTNPQMIFMND